MSAKVDIVSGANRIAGAFLLILYGAFTLMMLWKWFLVPLGVPPINMPHALGISALAGMLQSTPPADTKTSSSDFMCMLVIKYTLCLVIGAIAQAGV